MGIYKGETSLTNCSILSSSRLYADSNISSTVINFQEMISGDPPLVHVSKRKYSLTTQPAGAAGIDVAKALHSLAHHQNICQCRQFVAI